MRLSVYPFQTQLEPSITSVANKSPIRRRAVSELWKNAYDAYARAVALHIFDGEVPLASVFDDGSGMSKAEFIDRWLVLGTDAKISTDAGDADRDAGSPKSLPRPKGDRTAISGFFRSADARSHKATR